MALLGGQQFGTAGANVSRHLVSLKRSHFDNDCPGLIPCPAEHLDPKAGYAYIRSHDRPSRTDGPTAKFQAIHDAIEFHALLRYPNSQQATSLGEIPQQLLRIVEAKAVLLRHGHLLGAGNGAEGDG